MVVALALTSAACWGLTDFLAGLASRQLAVPLVLLLVEGAGLAVVLVVALVAGEPFFHHPGDVLSSLAAGLSGVLGLGCFFRALAIGTMSVVAPISAAGVVLPVIAGIARGDRPTPIAAIGLVTIVAGVVLASREHHADADAAAAGRTSIGLALLSAIGFGGFYVLSDKPADASVLWMLVLARSGAVPLVGLIALRMRPALPSPRLALGLAAVGVLDLAATALIGVANTKGALSTVAVLGSMYPVATVLLAAALLHERLRPPQRVGVVLALAGVAAVAGG
jgi:drug/metabolite transporter (DMT)-like permease